MTITEKVAYLTGLEAGLKLNAERPETKLFNSIIDILSDVAVAVDANTEDIANMNDRVDEVDMDLGELEALLYGALEEEDGEDELYEVECPNCHERFSVDESVLEDGGIECPKCGEKLEFEIELEEDTEEAE